MSAQPQVKTYRAVFFDIGGVVVGSPMSGIAIYEKRHGLPHNYINFAITNMGSSGAFQMLEMGQLSLFDFYPLFGSQLSDPMHVEPFAKYCQKQNVAFDKNSFKIPAVDGRDLFHIMMAAAMQVDPAVVHAIKTLKQSGQFVVCALTNNFLYPDTPAGHYEQELIAKLARTQPFLSSTITGSDQGFVLDLYELKTLFDHYHESALLGLRKPDPKFYLKACEITGVMPEEVVFLDDIGHNLKAAQALGMATIRVPLGNSRPAIAQLEQHTQMTLTLERQSPKL